jgi:hypothetical protein
VVEKQEPKPAATPPAAKDPRRPAVDKPPTDAQQTALQGALDAIDACESMGDFVRTVRTIGEDTRGKKIHPSHVESLHAYAKKKQESLKAKESPTQHNADPDPHNGAEADAYPDGRPESGP